MVTKAVVPPRNRWTSTFFEIVISLLCIAYLATADLGVMVAWEIIGVLYVIFGIALIWRGENLQKVPKHEAKEIFRWTWVTNVLAAVVGIYSAIIALSTQGQQHSGSDDTLVAILASMGVALSWIWLHVGFAEIYQVLDSSDEVEKKGIEFPDDTRSMLNYVYFSFTIAVSFATSDPTVVSVPVRRMVLIHSILSFFYNAIVVAIAFQVIQSLIGR